MMGGLRSFFLYLFFSSALVMDTLLLFSISLYFELHGILQLVAYFRILVLRLSRSVLSDRSVDK